MDKRIRTKICRLREKGWSLGKLVKKFGIAKTTIYYWIKDYPVPKINGIDIRTIAHRKSIKNALDKRIQYAKEKRAKAYNEGCLIAKKILTNPFFRDFIVLYITEGYNRTRATLSITNTDPSIIKLSLYFLRRLTQKRIYFDVVCQKNEKLQTMEFWSKKLDISKDQIRIYPRKLGQKRPRLLAHGICNIRVHDTYAKSRLDAYINYLKEQWNKFPQVGKNEI